MDARTALVEDLFGPPAIGLGAQGQVAVKRLQEIGILAAHISDDFVAVRRHQTCGVDQDPMELRGVREAVPIHLLHLPRFVGMQEEVTARGASRERQGGARIHDTASGHAVLTQANAVPTPSNVFSGS